MLVFQIFLPILHDDKWIIFCVNKPQGTTEVLSSNAHEAAMDFWSETMAELVEENMNKNIVSGKLSFSQWKSRSVEVLETSADAILLAMSFIESYGGGSSFIEIITKTVSVFWLNSPFASHELLSNLSLLFLFAVMVY